MRSRIKLYFYLAAFMSGALVLMFSRVSATP